MKPFSVLAAIFFILVALLHLLRLLLGVPILVGSLAVPVWASVPAVLVPGLLAFGLWRERGS
jgi:hypothetical protein